MMQVNLTEDRVRGVMYYGTIRDYVDEAKLAKIQKFVKNKEGIVLVYGFGASLITKGDLLIYADLTRWEIQLRYRADYLIFKQSNYDEDPLIKISVVILLSGELPISINERFLKILIYI